MTMTIYLSGSRKVTITADDGAFRSKDLDATTRKALLGSAQMWAFETDAKLTNRLMANTCVSAVKIDRY